MKNEVQLIPALDACGLKERVNALIIDSLKDPTDRFNFSDHQVEVVGEMKHDWNYEYYLINSGSDEDVGFIKITKFHDSRYATIAFYLKKEFRDKGILKDCVPFIANRIFWDLGYNKVEAGCFDTNKRAMAVYGQFLKHIGTRRQRGYFDGKYVDYHFYEALKSETVFANSRRDQV